MKIDRYECVENKGMLKYDLGTYIFYYDYKRIVEMLEERIDTLSEQLKIQNNRAIE